MRKSTLLWLVLAVISGGILFHTSQQVTDGHTKLATLTQNIREEEETIRVLRAEWSYLNQPARLEKLSDQYLKLQPLTGKQMIKPADLPDRPAPPEPVAVAAAGDVPPATTPQTLQAAPVQKPKAESLPLHTVSAKPAAVILAKPKPVPTAAVTAALPVAAHAPTPPRRTTDDRSFGDVMKSLGAAKTQRGAY